MNFGKPGKSPAQILAEARWATHSTTLADLNKRYPRFHNTRWVKTGPYKVKKPRATKRLQGGMMPLRLKVRIRLWRLTPLAQLTFAQRVVRKYHYKKQNLKMHVARTSAQSLREQELHKPPQRIPQKKPELDERIYINKYIKLKEEQLKNKKENLN